MPPHSCLKCSPNLCKSCVLNDLNIRNCQDLQDRRIIYVGDGRNDFCPCSTVLKECDYACCRYNCALHELMSELHSSASEEQKKAIANICPWENGQQLYNIIIDQILEIRE